MGTYFNRHSYGEVIQLKEINHTEDKAHSFIAYLSSPRGNYSKRSAAAKPQASSSCGVPWIFPKQRKVHCLVSADCPNARSSSILITNPSACHQQVFQPPPTQNAAVWRWWLDLPRKGWLTVSFHAQPTVAAPASSSSHSMNSANINKLF